MRIYEILVASILVWIEQFVSGATRKTFWDKISHKTVGSAPEPETDAEDELTIEEMEEEIEAKGKGKQGSVPVIIDRLVRTFLVILTRKSLQSKVYIDDDSYEVESYVFPASFWEIARARVIYLSRSAKSFCDPIFRLVIEKEISQENLMTPMDVKLFFDRFNQHQEDNTTIRVEAPGASFEETTTLCDLKAFMMRGQLGDLNEDGTISPIVTQILQIEYPFSAEQANLYSPYHERSVAKWLLSTKRSTQQATKEISNSKDA